MVIGSRACSGDQKKKVCVQNSLIPFRRTYHFGGRRLQIHLNGISVEGCSILPHIYPSSRPERVHLHFTLESSPSVDQNLVHILFPNYLRVSPLFPPEGVCELASQRGARQQQAKENRIEDPVSASATVSVTSARPARAHIILSRLARQGVEIRGG